MDFVVDYQQVIDLCAAAIRYALPIGLIFGVSEKAVNMFLCMALGKERIKL